MYTNDRDAYRHYFFTVWQKYLSKQPLDASEAQLAEIIRQHPQFHDLLNATNLKVEFAMEENPFFHMSLHLALREQIHTNRPAGIAEVYQRLCNVYSDVHEVQHRMMECLCRMISLAQQTGVAPEDEVYLNELRKLS